MTEYYVSQVDGNDSYNGEYPTFQGGSDGPWLTVDKADDLAGDQSDNFVYFRRHGEWRERYIVGCSGTSNHPFTIGAYGSGARPIINGMDIMTGWASYGAGAGNTYYVQNIGSTTSPGTLMVLVDRETKLIYGSDKDNLAEGEFYHNNTDDDLYIRLSGDADPDDYFIEAQVRRDCIRGGADDYITVQNLKITGGFDGIWLYENCDYWIIDNCTFINVGDHNIKIEGTSGNECTYNTAGNNICTDNGGCGRSGSINPFGLRIDYGNNNTIEGNLFQGGDWGGAYITNSDSNILRYNWIEAEGSNAVTLVTSDSNELYYNVIILNFHDYDWILQLSSGSLNNEIYNNVLYGGADRGVNFTGNSTGSKFKNNIIHNTTTIIQVDSGSETSIEIDYNCYKNTTGTPFDWTGTDYNFADWQTNSSQDDHSFNTDPLFVSPGLDFRLQSSSPCINAGTDVSLSEDYRGVAVPVGPAPDIGAFEFNEYASDWLENAILKHVFKVSAMSQPSNLYVALCKSTIEDDDTGSTLPSEVSGGDYARKQCNTWSISGGTASNNIALSFPEATNEWGLVTDFAICDASTGGNMFYYGKFNNSKHVHTGDIFTIAIGDLSVEAD